MRLFRNILLVNGKYLLLALSLLIATSCLKKSEKQKPYYYSEEEIDRHKAGGNQVVDIADTKSVIRFLKSNDFVSKTFKIEIGDSLSCVVTNNGRVEVRGKIEIGEFMINDERLILLKDESGEVYRFTLSHNGFFTDKETYALYRPLPH